MLTPPDFTEMTPSAVADTVRSRIQLQIDYLVKGTWGNALAVEYSERDIEEFVAEMNMDNVPDEVVVRNAVSVRYARLRNVPSFYPEQVGVRENAKTRWDMWGMAILKICSPVVVLHPSKSGEYLLVYGPDGYGWAESQYIAFGSEEALSEFTDPQDFLLCTDDRIQFYSDRNRAISSGWIRMGDRLPRASAFENRKALIPVRKVDGELTKEVAYLRQSDGVHVGWLPYTRRNIVETAFKLLDNTYDFTGAWFGRQHENTYRDIFAVFGFRLPWHGALFTVFGHNETVMQPEIGTEGQYRVVMTNEPFVTLQSCGGHAQLYLGEYEGMPMVFDQHGYGYEDENGVYVEVRRCCISDVRTPNYFLKRKVTFLELK